MAAGDRRDWDATNIAEAKQGAFNLAVSLLDRVARE